jgi:acyl-CoA synthetase (AMP-forming)/AMP-acid ligase II
MKLDHQVSNHAFWRIGDGPADRIALILQDGRSVSYGELSGLVEAMRARLDAGPGLVELLCPNNVNTVAMYLAALQVGYPLVLAAPQGEGSPCPLDILYAYDPDTDILAVKPKGRGQSLHPDLRLLLSTSGSTGARKFVRLSDRNIVSNAGAIAGYLSLTETDRAPLALPLSYSFGLSVLNSHLAVGASLVLTEGPVMSEAFWQSFAKTGCTSFSGVPQTFALIARGGQLDRDYPQLRYVTQAGGKLSPEAVRDLAALGRKRGWDFFVMYGQTEAAPRMAYLPPDLAMSHPAAIGRAIPGGTITVEDETGTVPRGTEGELVYEGPNVMMGYATETADLARPQGATRLRTGDLGYENEAGLLVITGRRSRFLKLSGKRVSLDEIEAWAARNGLPVVATGADDALCLIHTGGQDETSLKARIASFLGVPRSFVTTIEASALPLKQNMKPDHQAARAMFEAHRGLVRPRARSVAPEAALEKVLEAFRRQFPGAMITPDMSFDRLGGSSADFIDIELALQEIGIDLPGNWQNYPIAELSDRIDAGSGDYRPDYGVARIICTILVVLGHVIGNTSSAGLRLPQESGWHDVMALVDPLTMPMFAFLAGLFFSGSRMQENAPGRFAATILRQLLLPTYVAILVFALLSTMIGTDFALETPLAALELLYRPYAHFWFILSLTVILSFCYVVARVLSRPAIPLAAIALVILLSGIRAPSTIFGINGALALFPVFVLGCFFGWYSRWFLDRRNQILGLAVLIVAAMHAWGGDAQLPPAVQRLAEMALSIAMIVLCFAVARLLPVLRPLTPYAFMIYLWHIVGTSAMRRALDVVGVDVLMVDLVGGLVAGLAVPILLFHLLGVLPGGRLVRGK